MAFAPIVFSVTSGKGGVGKTNISVSLAYALASLNQRVVLLDGDLGLGNIDVLLGLTPPYNLLHLLRGEKKLKEILYPTDFGFSILPAASGMLEMTTLSNGQKLELLEAMDPLENEVDYLIVDTGAGIHDHVIYFNLAVERRIIVMTTEPTSLTDAYALIKILKNKHKVNNFEIIINMAPDLAQGKETFKKLYLACDKFLDSVSLNLLGIVPLEKKIRKYVQKQKPFMQDKSLKSTKVINQIAKTILNWPKKRELDGNIKFFWKKLLFQNE
ncbi:flagellar biosynthesis protein FlhG [Desulfonauticus submarinus]|uniref:Flagellar biosynthesis protein FlhG n=1 Tax=Desulfonauticus submarinus TaxID=206665 RepID=A0A1H0B6Y2_9BACT|nr:MinD/ParA family protein [Desulfonauticus submarinus]SDN41103.1 flagellar biosynthesis protein FlhG [Desulfonauticus submarinus]